MTGQEQITNAILDSMETIAMVRRNMKVYSRTFLMICIVYFNLIENNVVNVKNVEVSYEIDQVANKMYSRSRWQ